MWAEQSHRWCCLTAFSGVTIARCGRWPACTIIAIIEPAPESTLQEYIDANRQLISLEMPDHNFIDDSDQYETFNLRIRLGYHQRGQGL